MKSTFPPSTTVDPILQAPDAAHAAHLEEARRVLALPLEVNRLRWHPFGVYVVPLSRREEAGDLWSRRLHLWHPSGTPVGETSPYGVHTHTGTARSHVLAGSLQHHLYAFVPDEDGAWQENGMAWRRARLVAHAEATTAAGETHTLPAHQPHAVTRPGGFAASLFVQAETTGGPPFTMFQRLDAPAETLRRQAPADLQEVLVAARVLIEQALWAAAD